MRGLRSFIGLMVILLALGAYLYFVESKREPGGADAKEKVFSVEADKVEEVTVRAESGDRTTLRKTEGDWQIVSPLTAPTDSAAVSGITSNLATLEVQRVIEENPGDLAEFGLAQPRIEVAFKADGQERTLQIGRKTPPGTDVYAKLAGQNRVFLISSYLESTFNKGTFDLRDKSVLKVERDKIDALTVTTPRRTVRFVKAGNDWQLAEPVKARADFTSVDGLVSRLNTLQMKSEVAAAPAGVAEYGLDKPVATVQLGSGSSQATLLIGKDAPESAVYARDQSKSAVITIDKSLLDDLTKDPGEFRQKDLFDARTFNATRIEVARDGQTTAFEKSRTKNQEGQEEEKWRRVAPSEGDVDQTKVESLISAATLARASGFVDQTAKTGLDKPLLTVTITSEEGKKEERVAFARAGSEAYASRAGEPGAARIEPSTLDSLVKALDDVAK
ncbi:MAG TPA: DUF4340 domain-containing protein [Vicinamibacterales bacterium]|nr:DUF4340 domain-containing protein [Vicinamibacterales bacterium]